MAAKKRTTKPTSPQATLEIVVDALQSQKALIEEMRSENRLTAESVATKVDQLEAALDRMNSESRDRDALLEAAIRSLRSDLARVEGKMDRVIPLEERVAALERRGA